MNVAFYVSAAVAIAATAMTITRADAMHALLYLIVSLLAVAVVFFVLGAPFAAVLEVIVYAGAIMVLFVFVVMMLNLGERATERERGWLAPKLWIGPSILSGVLLVQLVYMIADGAARPGEAGAVGAAAVAARLFGPYLLAVELASMLLLAGLVGAYRLGRGIESPAASGSGRAAPAREHQPPPRRPPAVGPPAAARQPAGRGAREAP